MHFGPYAELTETHNAKGPILRLWANLRRQVTQLTRSVSHCADPASYNNRAAGMQLQLHEGSKAENALGLVQPVSWTNGAGDENRTHTVSLGTGAAPVRWRL
jgi:hypothetical protein